MTAGSRIFGALLEENNGVDRAIKYFYDTNNGNLLATVNVYDGTGTVYTYDGMGRLTGVTPATYSSSTGAYTAVTNAQSVDYTYDSRNMLSTVSTDSTTYTFTYDVWGNQSSVAIGSTTLASYEYNDETGTLKKMTYGNGTVVNYTYNELDMLTRVTFTSSSGTETVAYEYEYTAMGQVHKLIDHMSGIETVYTYDGGGRLLSEVRYDSDEMVYDFTKRVSYDSEGKVSEVNRKMDYAIDASEDYFFHQNLYYYNAEGSLNRETVSVGGNGVTVNYTYDNFDRLVEKSGDNGITTSYEYREFGTNQTDLLVSSYTNTINGVDSTYTYTYDKNGNITRIVDSQWLETVYTYDDLGQLTSEEWYTSADDSIIYAYTYDNAGNITKVQPYEKNIWGTFPLSSSKAYSYTNTAWGDLLTSIDGHTITYDEIGNPLSYYSGTEESTYSYTWQGRNLMRATRGSVTYSFTYDDSGIRTSKKRNNSNTEYYYDGTQLIAEKYLERVIVYLYDSTGSPIGMKYRDAFYGYNVWDTYWFEKNIQGDIIAVYSDDGTKLISYTYDAWGNFTTQYYNNGNTSTARYNNLRYRGYYYDDDLGLYYLISRYYDSYTGRFINADSLLSNKSVLGNNMFTYCLNNPVNMADTTGELPFFIVTAAIGAVVGAIAGGVIAANNGGNIWAGIGIGAGAGALVGTGAGMVAGAALAGSITATTGAVIAGGSTLVATVGTGGVGAGVTYVANNLSQATNNLFSLAQTTSSKMQQIFEKGRAGELAANITKNHSHIASLTGTANYRVPDMLDRSAKILGEVKNYSGTISLTAQLKDFVLWSQLNGYQMYLITNSKSFTGPLQQLIDNGVIRVFPFG